MREIQRKEPPQMLELVYLLIIVMAALTLSAVSIKSGHQSIEKGNQFIVRPY